MIKKNIVVAGIGLIATLNQVECAPAPQVATVIQTATQVLSEDGSIHTQFVGDDQAVSTSIAENDIAAKASSSDSTDSGFGGFRLSSFLSNASWRKFLSFLHGNSGDNDSGSNPTSPSTTTSSSGTYTQATSSTEVIEPTSSTNSPVSNPTSTSTTPTSYPTSGTSSPSDSDIYDQINDSNGIDKTFSRQILDAHNRYRSEHQAEDLSWDKDAYDYAQNYADNYDCSGVLTHSHGRYGENLAAGYNTGPSAVKAWYDEGQSYNYNGGSTYDHFTQVVWKGSTKVGCAYKDCSSTGWAKYIICSYDPPGNVIGQSGRNVLPQSGR